MKQLKKFFTDPINRRVTAEVQRRMALQNLTPNTHFSEDDIFVASYPKSGNTWFQYLLTGFYYGVNTNVAPDRLVLELVPDIHFMKYYSRVTTPMFFKTHHFPRPEYKRVVYLVRDGRDVMVSYYHHLMATRNGNIDFMEMVRDGKGLSPSKWDAHVNVWRENPYKAEILFIKYEDLQHDPLNELTRLCEFAQIERDQEILTSAIAQADFTKMKDKEAKNPSSFHPNKEWPDAKAFVRRGVVGSYKDEMPHDVLKVFLDYAGDALVGMGYNAAE